MRIFGPKHSISQAKGFYIVKPKPANPFMTRKNAGMLILIVAVSNLFTYGIFGKKNEAISNVWEVGNNSSNSLYLIDEAANYIQDIESFELKVRDVATALNIPPEWLMAVMYSESRLNPAAVNLKGSGATGLIQFMVATVKDMNIKMGTRFYMSDIRNMDAVDQMDLVFEYLDWVQQHYGEYKTLTDLYLGILYPRAVGKEDCYTLYAKPSQKYLMNAGLDDNRDGRVTVSDIDKRMLRIYPTAYKVSK